MRSQIYVAGGVNGWLAAAGKPREVPPAEPAQLATPLVWCNGLVFRAGRPTGSGSDLEQPGGTPVEPAGRANAMC